MYEINKHLVLSIEHVKPEDISKIKENIIFDSYPFLIADEKGYNGKFGYHIMLPIEDKDWNDTKKQFSSMFMDVLNLAKFENCNWITLDIDGPVYTTLQVSGEHI